MIRIHVEQAPTGPQVWLTRPDRAPRVLGRLTRALRVRMGQRQAGEGGANPSNLGTCRPAMPLPSCNRELDEGGQA